MKLPWEMTKPQFKAFLACMICASMATFTILMVASTVKQVAESYHLSYLNSIWIAESSALSAIIFAMFSADLCDKFGKRRILVAGMALMIISSVIAVLSFDFYSLMISRTIAGAGVAMVYSSNVSILTDLCKKEYLPEVMSFSHVATSIGGACGPLLGQYISVTFGLTALFLSTIPLCVLAIIMIRYADNIRMDPEKRINYPLHALVAASTAILISAIMSTSKGCDYLWIVAIAACGIAFFFYRRSKNKIFDFSILRNHGFSSAVVIGLLFTICAYTVDDTLSYYLQMDDVKLSFFGLAAITTAGLAALTRAIKPIVQIIASPTIARLSRGRDANHRTFISFTIPIASVALVFTIHHIFYEPGWIIIVCIVISVLIGFGNSLFKPMNKSIMMSSVPEEQRNAASSVSNLIDNLGRVVGIFVMVNVLDMLGGITELSVIISLNIIAVMILILSSIGLYLCFRRGRKKAVFKIFNGM